MYVCILDSNIKVLYSNSFNYYLQINWLELFGKVVKFMDSNKEDNGQSYANTQAKPAAL
jgi:hypothetical protein